MPESFRIPYPTRSKFIDEMRTAVQNGKQSLSDGKTIEIVFETGGYAAKWTVMIRPGDQESFEVAGSITDPTRFPQRVRVAAWALYQEGLYGAYLIQHDRDSGVVSIRQTAA